MQGRDTGSEGHRRAAEYVAAEFQRAGLIPAGTSGYFQAIRFQARRIREKQSSLSLVREGRAEDVQLGEEAFLHPRPDAPQRLEAEAVFVGYGLRIPEQKHDDLAGLDLKGKIAVYLQGGPASIRAPILAHYQSQQERWRSLQRAGAIGMAAIPHPRAMDIPWERWKLLRNLPSLSLREPASAEMQGQQIGLTIHPGSADKFFQGTGHTLAQILDVAAAGRALPKFPLACAIRAVTSVEEWEVESENVVGLLPGAHSRRRNEYVVLTAHLDHLGAGSPIDGDSIYNGAMDNAAGVASLLEIARTLKDASLERSVLFAAVTGEEKGLLGSQHLLASRSAPLDQIVANINLDMFLPIHELRVLHVYGLSESSLGTDIRELAWNANLRLIGDPEPERNILIRSDQYSFIRRGIPAIFCKFGYLQGTPEERAQKEWLRRRYHAPSDDTSQPVNIGAAGKFNQLMATLTKKVADARRRPRWNSRSFFRRYTGRET